MQLEIRLPPVDLVPLLVEHIDRVVPGVGVPLPDPQASGEHLVLGWRVGRVRPCEPLHGFADAPADVVADGLASGVPVAVADQTVAAGRFPGGAVT